MTHRIHITTQNHHYPFRAVCTCGWSGHGYPTSITAEISGEEHVKEAQQ